MNKPRLANPHYQGLPCARCNGRTRYTTTRACVTCAKAHVRKRRGTITVVASASELTGARPTLIVMDDIVDDGADLL